MNQPISFFLPIIPPKATSQGAGKRMVIIQNKATGKPRPMFFKNKKSEQAEGDFLVLCSPYRPPEPISGPIELQVIFTWPWRAGEPQWRRELGRAFHTTRPDCSNMIKQIEDVLTKLRFWHDDGQVSDEIIRKRWGNRVGITITIFPLEEPVKPERKMKDKKP